MTVQQKRSLVLRFRIEGNLAYLSHHETMSMFQRAFNRSAIEVCYSQGFNPRPKLSLPFPRSVGIVSEDELLCASVSVDPANVSSGQLQDQLQRELPEGCVISSVSLSEGKVSARPMRAVYSFGFSSLAFEEGLGDRIEVLRRSVADGKELYVERSGNKKKRPRRIDVSDYIESVECEAETMLVECNITTSGTVRIDEILQLLEVDNLALAGSITRKSVEWEMK